MLGIGKKTETQVSTVKIAFWYVVSNLFAKGIAFITTPIFSRMLSKTEYGQFTNFTSWEGILLIFATLDLNASIARAKYDFDEEIDNYITSIVMTSNIFTLILLGVIECNNTFFENFFSMDLKYIRILFVYLLFEPAFAFLQTKYRIYKKYKFFVFFSIFGAILRTFASIGLLFVWEDKLFARVIGYIIPITVLNIGLWALLWLKGHKIRWIYIKYALKITVPLVPHALAGNLLNSCDKIMITRFCGAEATSLYSIPYTVAMLAVLIWTAMNQAWTPWLYDKINENNIEEIREKSKKYLGIFAVLIVGVLLIAPEIVLILGGKQYYEARYVMPPIIAGFVFQFIYGMYVNIEIYEKKTAIISVSTIMASILNITLNRWLIPIFGYVAAPYTTFVGYVALFVFHKIIVKRMKKYQNIYNEKFEFTVAISLVLFAGLMLFLYNNFVLRYVLVLIYVIVVLYGIYKEKDKIYKLFK